MRKDISLVSYAKAIGKSSTAKLTFGDMMLFPRYLLQEVQNGNKKRVRSNGTKNKNL